MVDDKYYGSIYSIYESINAICLFYPKKRYTFALSNNQNYKLN